MILHSNLELSKYQILTECLAEGNSDCTWATVHRSTNILNYDKHCAATDDTNIFRRKSMWMSIILKLLKSKVIWLQSICVSSYCTVSINRIFNTGEDTLHADGGSRKKKLQVLSELEQDYLLLMVF